METTFDALLCLMKNRRSIRRFRPDPVPADRLDKLIEAAGWAPSAGNRQPYRFFAVSGTDTLEAMVAVVKEETRRLRQDLRKELRPEAETYLENFTRFQNAPLVLVPIYRKGPDLLKTSRSTSSPGDMDRAEADALSSVSGAIMNLLLGAHALGLGACWMTGPLIAREALEALLRVPKGWAISALIPVGYPAETPEPPARRSLDKILTRVDE